MNKPSNMDVWILCTYAEKVGNDFPNIYRVLDKDLVKSFYILARIFDVEEFNITLNYADNDSEDDDEVNNVPFNIVRLEDQEIIGDVEYWPVGY